MIDEDAFFAPDLKMFLGVTRQTLDTAKSECKRLESVEQKLLKLIAKADRASKIPEQEATSGTSAASDSHEESEESGVGEERSKSSRERDPGSRRKPDSYTDALQAIVLKERRIWWAMAVGKRAIELGVMPAKRSDEALRKGAYALLTSRSDSGDIKRIKSLFMAPDFTPSEAELNAAREAAHSNRLTYNVDTRSASS